MTSLGSLISMDPKAAVTFLDSLSKTYRYILKSSERETVPLTEELKFGESFVKLQKTRFGEGLQVNFKVDEEDFHRKIVPVTLQNLLENAIKHNIIDEDEPLVIDVFVEGDYLVVQNNLQRKKFVETSNKRGLTNLQSFYRYLSDKPIVVEEDGAFFRIKIPLI
ncbi:MAG: histidine kinase [Saprospiraceae bacterium]|nr:histidine kinase [Saprospiraceae bacterium]